MTRHMKIERLSIRMLNGTSKDPLLIHVQYVKSPESLFENRISVATNEAQTTPGPTMTVTIRGSRQPRPASRIAPAAGQMRLSSAILHQLIPSARSAHRYPRRRGGERCRRGWPARPP